MHLHYLRDILKIELKSHDSTLPNNQVFVVLLLLPHSALTSFNQSVMRLIKQNLIKCQHAKSGDKAFALNPNQIESQD